MRSDLEIYQSLTPGWLHRQLHGLGGESPRPHSEEVDCVLMFVDISGFTALSERLAAVGAEDGGAEGLVGFPGLAVRRLRSSCAQCVVTLRSSAWRSALRPFSCRRRV